ncbi:hypothetical protein NQZ79_g5679 [Umbelopsis isabellina]|nr:hypothetical protein NQZ79_g5679 [Umbelopsis isabellina]
MMILASRARSPQARTNEAILLSGLAIIGASAYYYQMKKKNYVACEGKSDSTVVREKTLGYSWFQTITLRETQLVGNNTKLLRFDLPKKDQVAGHTVHSVVLLRIAKPGTENNYWPTYVLRPYTPVSEDTALGYIEFIIKSYEDGKASKYLHSLKPGDKIQIWGPISKYTYETNKYDSIGLIAGGSAIAPMLQLLRKVLNNPEDKTKVSFLYCNSTEEDIILREELDEMAATHPDQFKVTHIISKPSATWGGESGRITAELVKKHMPLPNDNSLMLVCGPNGLVRHVVGSRGRIFNGKKGILEE